MLRSSQTYRPRGVILIIGAIGHVGKETLMALSKDSLSADFNIRAGVRDLDEGKKKADSFGADAVECDLEKPDTVHKQMQGVSKVFLILPNTKNNVASCKVAIDAAKAAGVGHVLFLSMMGCESKDFWAAKQFKECEEYIEASGLVYTFLRAFWFQENLIGLAKAITNANELRLSIGDSKVAPVSLIDIGEAACNILMGDENNYRNKTFNLTGDQLLSGDDIAKTMSKVSGKEIVFTSSSKEEMKKIYLEAGFEDWRADNDSDILDWLSKHESNVVVQDQKWLLQRQPTKLETTLNLHKDHFFVKTAV